MIASKRSVKMYNRKKQKETSWLERFFNNWNKRISSARYPRTLVGSGGWRKREENRIAKKLEKFGYELEVESEQI